MDAPDRAPGSDRDLHRRLLRGEETALGELYDRHAPLVHGLAARTSDDEAAAEQLTREVFAHLWNHPEAYAPSTGPLRSWLGGWTLGAGSGPAVEPVPCTDEPLDLPVGLRQQVLESCLAQRPAELPVPVWAAPYAAESARLDALLRDLGPEEWQEVAELAWSGGVQRWRAAEVLCHLAAVDACLAPVLGLPDPVPVPVLSPRVPAQGGDDRVEPQGGPAGLLLDRTLALIDAHRGRPDAEVRACWRWQSRALVRAAALGADPAPAVDYGFARLPLADAFLDRAFECWIHGEDLARAVDYPYEPPAAPHLRQLIGLGARMIPLVLDGARPGGRRMLKLMIEGPAAGEWLVPLDGDPDGVPVAELVVDGLEFCRLAAAHLDPDRVPVGASGDRAVIRQVLRALPLLSRP
ncbi:sigma factor [Kitasatospora cinereorecta]|uniref:sigma factor n=1 Tax=Kitasatospora cinereorecta TaxID=285560 RepID=UPI0031F888CC